MATSRHSLVMGDVAAMKDV